MKNASFCGFFLKFIYFETGRAQVEEEQREKERIPSRLCTVSSEPNAGLDPMDHENMAWAEIKSQMLNWLSHPSAPKNTSFKHKWSQESSTTILLDYQNILWMGQTHIAI